MDPIKHRSTMDTSKGENKNSMTSMVLGYRDTSAVLTCRRQILLAFPTLAKRSLIGPVKKPQELLVSPCSEVGRGIVTPAAPKGSGISMYSSNPLHPNPHRYVLGLLCDTSCELFIFPSEALLPVIHENPNDCANTTLTDK